MLRKTGLSLAIASALTLSGCFGGSSDDDPAPASTTPVSGTASKGIIVNGLVRAYLFNDNGTRATTAIASTTTNAEGDYTLAIPSQYSGQPLYIEITNNGGAATMRCDLAEGCDDDVGFGDDYDLGDGFSLSAVIPDSSDVVTTNLTPLTTVAALKAVDAIAEVGSNFAAASAIANANSSVANTLNAMLGTTTISDITEVEVIDLTDADEVADSLDDSIALRIATINAAIVSATQDDGEFTIEQAIDEFTEYMAENPLTFDSEVEGDTDIVDILTQANAVWNETVTAMIEELDLDEGDDLLEDLTGEGSLDDLIGDAIDDAVEEGDETADDDPSETAPDEELVQAKAFVEELRELGAAIDSSMVSGQRVDAILDNFEVQSEAADLASSEDVKQSFEALGRALGAIATVYEENFDMETGALAEDSAIESLPAEVAVDGITVIIALNNDLSPTLRVDGEVAVEGYETAADVDVTATVAAFTAVDDGTEYDTGTTWGDEGTVDAEIDLTIVGSAAAGTVEVGFGEGSHVSGSINGSYQGDGTSTGNGETFDDFIDATLTDFHLELNATIEQTESDAEDGPMSFSGGIELSVSSLRFIEESTDEWSCTQQSCSGSEESDTTITASVVGLDLRGNFGNESENFDAAFSISGNATGVTFRELYSSEWSNDGYSDNSSSTGETPTNYVEVEAHLDFDARLAGVADAVAFNLDVERTGYNDLDAQVRLAYPGRVIEVDSSIDNIDTPLMTATFTLSNNDDVTISVVRTADEVSGSIEVDGVVYGALVEGPNGLARIVYTDGTFVSLF